MYKSIYYPSTKPVPGRKSKAPNRDYKIEMQRKEVTFQTSGGNSLSFFFQMHP
jgi:hypothetical protein